MEVKILLPDTVHESENIQLQQNYVFKVNFDLLQIFLCTI